MTATFESSTPEKKEKVTVSIDARLLQLVDSFVAESKAAGMSRSAVFEQGLHLWKQHMRDTFDAKYYAENAQALKVDNESWSAITTQAARHTWNE